MRLQRISRRAARGFTLIELLLVLVILAILAAVVVPKFTGRTEQARISAAKADISSLKLALSTFETDTGRFPSAEEGLNALAEKPGDLQGWKKYVEKVPMDPWDILTFIAARAPMGRILTCFRAVPMVTKVAAMTLSELCGMGASPMLVFCKSSTGGAPVPR